MMKEFETKKAFTSLVKHFRSDRSHAELAQSPAMSSQTKLRSYGFTLAETLITLTVIGIIAVITVPAIISKHTESANRTKIKKAMSVYDTAINKMVIENGIKDNTALVSTAGTLENNCAGSSTYFKMTQGSGCEFKTSDGLWWNIEDIQHPYVAFNKDDLTKENAADTSNNKVFYFVGHIDESTGILRVNDYISEAEPNKGYLTKLYNFVKPEVGNAGGGNNEPAPFCNGEDSCESGGLAWNKFTIGEGDGITMTESDWGQSFCSWDPEKETCTETNSTAAEGPLYISEPLTLNASDAKSSDNCAESRNKSYCESNGDYWTLARRQCEASGGRLPTAAELRVMNSKGQLPSDGSYWAAETDPVFAEGSMLFYTNTSYEVEVVRNAYVGDDGFGTYYDKAVCVGN